MRKIEKYAVSHVPHLNHVLVSDEGSLILIHSRITTEHGASHFLTTLLVY